MKDNPVSPDEIRDELAHVLASAGFARNPRMSRFLTTLVERHLDRRDDELKETVLAVEVFGRRPDYDPKTDSIVRTEAARLRARLVEYYAGEGREAVLVIDLPKGGYVPVIRERLSIPAVARRPTWRPWAAVALACAGIILAVTGWRTRRSEPSPIPIAVLPLSTPVHDSSAEAFAAGLTDEIARNLGQIDGLAVRSRMSSSAFKGPAPDVREAGRQLNADYLLDGSVARADGRLRIAVQLVRARDDMLVWSGRFDRGAADVFAIEDEIALAIVNGLRLHLGRGRRRYETSVAAYDAYLDARSKGMGLGPRGRDAIDLFERAIAQDATFAPAYAGLAATYAVRSVQFPLPHSADELARMREVAERALELDPLLAEAHGALALADARAGRWDEAERRFRRAIELDPSRARTRLDFAMWFLDVLGRSDEGIEQMRRAEADDPLAPDVQLAFAWLLMSAGRYAEAAAHCERMSADHSLRAQCLGRARLGEGRVSDAISLLSLDPELAKNPQTRGFLGIALARSGRAGDARRMAEASTFPNERALICAGLGDKDGALRALESMAALGPQRVGSYLSSPEMALLRGDPRLVVLRRKVGLPA